MPPLPNAPNIILVRLKGAIQGTTWNNVFHLQYAGTGPSVADLQAVGAAINTSFVNQWIPLMSTSATYGGVDLADLTSPTTSQASVTANATGTRTGTGLPASACVVTSWSANVRYRGGHPRTYWCVGITTDLSNPRTVAPTFVTAVNNASTAFRTMMNSQTWSGATNKMVVLSYVRDGVRLANPVPYTITGNSVHGRLDTQRRRLGKEIP